MQTRRKGGKDPAIIAAEHLANVDSLAHYEKVILPRLKATAAKIEVILKTASKGGKKRTLYVEGEPNFVDHSIAGPSPHFAANFDSFSSSIKLADLLGMRVQPLDREWGALSIMMLLGQLRHPLLSRFLDNNLRHRLWAHKFTETPPNSRDIILMHPNHVIGFLTETALFGKKYGGRVEWVDRPTKRFKTRLDESELRTLLRDYRKGIIPANEIDEARDLFEEYLRLEKLHKK